MACKIIYKRKPNGEIDKSQIEKVMAPNGKRSLLFDTLNAYTDNGKLSFEKYQLTQLPQFKKWFGDSTNKDSNGDPIVEILNGDIRINNGKQSRVLLFDKDYKLSTKNNSGLINLESEAGFRNKDGSRKRYKSENSAIKKALEYNKNNYNFVAKTIKVMGEKGDDRVYWAVKLNPSGNTKNPKLDQLFGNKLNDTVSNVLDRIANDNHPLNTLASRLKDYIDNNNPNIKIQRVEDIDTIISTSGRDIIPDGIYYSKTGARPDRIAIKENASKPEVVILHEVIHALTFNALRDPKNIKLISDFDDVYKHAKSQFKDGKYRYALEDIDEFIVALFTDSTFIKELQSKKPLEGKGKYNNLLEQIFDYMLSLFNITKSDNLYNQAFSIATHVIDAQEMFVPSDVPANEINEMYSEMDDYYNNELPPISPLASMQLQESSLDFTSAEIDALYKSISPLKSEPSPQIATNIYELNPDITESEIKNIYNNYVKLMGIKRKGKEMPYDSFKSLMEKYQVFNYKDTYIFGQYDKKTGVFVTRVNSSPTSKELLAEAIPAIADSGADVLSLVPADYASKLKRSGYTITNKGFNYNFKGEDMIKYGAASNPRVFKKLFGKNFNEVTGDDLVTLNNSLTLDVEPVQIDAKLIKQAENKIDKVFETFLNQFGIAVKDLKDIKSGLGVDSLGFADILNKVAYVNNKSELPPIAGEFIAYMMQHDPLVKNVLFELAKMKNDENVLYEKDGELKVSFRRVDNAYLQEYLKEVGELIAQDVENKLEGKYQKSLIDTIKNLISKFLKILFNQRNNGNLDVINENIGIISNNIMNQNYRLVLPSLYKPGSEGKPHKQVKIEDALKQDKFGASIIKNYAKRGMILVGSTAVGEQGTVYRPASNLLHDIDFVSSLSKDQVEEMLLEEHGSFEFIRDIDNTENDYVTQTYLVPPKGYVIKNLYKEGKTNKVVSYDVHEEPTMVYGKRRTYEREGEKVGSFRLDRETGAEIIEGKEAKLVDFFVYNHDLDSDYKSTTYTTEAGEDIILSHWSNIFNAKLEWARVKDIWDYNRFTPNENIPFINIDPEKAKMLNEISSSHAKKSFNKILNGLSNRFGIQYTIINNPSDTRAGYYNPDGTVVINEAYLEEYPDTPFHEFFHPFLDTIEKTNKDLFNNLKSQIDKLIKNKNNESDKLRMKLNRILNDSDYVNSKGELNNLGYKEAITELVGAYALDMHNTEWRRRNKENDSSWTESPFESMKGPGISERTRKEFKPLFERLMNAIRGMIRSIFRNKDTYNDKSGFVADSAMPVIPSELNPNMTLSDFGYLMGVETTRPVRLDLEASFDQPVQAKKVDGKWINEKNYAGNKYTDKQRKFIETFNEVSGKLSGEHETVDVSEFSDRKLGETLSKKYDTVRVYGLEKPNQKGRKFVERRVTMLQDLKFLSRSTKTKEEFKAEENAPGSKLSREMGTKLHETNEDIYHYLLEAKIPVDTTMEGYDWADKVFDEVVSDSSFYKTFVQEIEKGNTPFAYEKILYDTYYDDYTGEMIETSDVKRDATHSYNELVKSMLRLYHEVYKVQNSIDPTKEPIFLLEKPVYDEEADEAGTLDFLVILSDNTALIYDHKFINYKQRQVTFDEFKSRPENEGKSDKEVLESMNTIRKMQGMSAGRKGKDYDTRYFYEVDEENNQALYRWKQDSYDLQLSRYSEILREKYGVANIRQARIIPSAVSYTSFKDKDGNWSVDPEKSKLKFLMTGERQSKLLKYIPVRSELTDDSSLNIFIERLEDEKAKIRSQLNKKGWDKNPLLVSRFNKITDAINSLKLNKDLFGIIDIVKSLNEELNEKLEHPKLIEQLDPETGEVMTDESGDAILIPNPEYITLEDINEFTNEMNLYAEVTSAAETVIKDLKDKRKDSNEYDQFMAELGVATTLLIEKGAILKEKTIELLLDINRESEFMSEEMFMSYETQSDINQIQRYMTHLGNVRHPLVNMFKQMLDQVNFNVINEEEVLLKEIKEKNDALKAWAKSQGMSVYKAYEKLLNGKKNLVYKWNQRYFDDVKRLAAYPNLEQRKKNIEEFKSKFHRSKDQEKAFQKYKKNTKAFLEKKFGKDTEKFKVAWDSWQNKHDIMYNDGNNDAWFVVDPTSYEPKEAFQEQYMDDRYKYILANKPLKEFYDFYRKTNMDLNAMVDFKIKSNFVAEIHKDMIDSLVQNGISATRAGRNALRSIKNAVKYRESEDRIDIAEEDKSIPIMYMDSVRVEDKSIDLAKNMMLFASSVHRYKGLKDMESAALSLRRLVAETPLIETDIRGRKKKISGEAFKPSGKDNKTILALFDSMINHYIYGEKMTAKIKDSGLSPQAAKIVSKLVELNSKKNIAFNLLSATAGHLGSMAQINKFAKESKYFTAKQLATARNRFSNMNKKSVFADEYFRLSQENMGIEKANEINSSLLRNKYTRGGLYWLQRKSDDVLEHTVLVAMMQNYGIDPKTMKAERLDFLKDKYKDHKEYGAKAGFEWKSIDQMIEMDDDKSNPKFINPYTGEKFGQKEYISFRRKTQEVIKKVKGNMSGEDIAGYKTTLVGQVLMQFKGWLPSMLRDRTKKAQYDKAMEEFEVGTWIAMYDMMRSNAKYTSVSLLRSMIPTLGLFKTGGVNIDGKKGKEVFDKMFKNWKENNPGEYAEMMTKFGYNPKSEEDQAAAEEVLKKEFAKEYGRRVKGFAKELQMYLFYMSIMGLIMTAMGDNDEEKNPILAGTVKTLERAMLEVGFFLPVFDYITSGNFEMGKMLGKSPVPVLGVVTDGLRTASNTIGETFDILSGLSPFENEKISAFNIQKDPWTNPFTFETKKDKTPPLKYTTQWIPGFKGVSNVLGLFETTDKKDTIWDWLSEPGGRIR